ncbi:MAG TPA: hypothetical protein GX701_07435 [Clostridiales bacterium]|nr:hypothetical protein [Clostridiales bacterium]
MMLPQDVLQILTMLNSAGFEAYVVGGCVRDALLGRKPSDWDIASSATPEQAKAVFSSHTVIPTGLAHGTITLLWNGVPYEITSFRTDGPYSDGRRPDSVVFGTSLQEDLSRRDFTINAMAYSPSTGLVDPFGGQADLARGLIRCVGNPEARFTEDGLRILRAVRFSAMLGFDIEEKTHKAAFALFDRLSFVAAERKTVELQKCLAGKAPGKGIFDFSPLWQASFPALAPPSMPPAAFDGARERPNLSLAFFVSGSILDAVLPGLRLSSAQNSSVRQIVKWLSVPCPVGEYAVRRFLAALSKSDAMDVLLGWKLLERENADLALQTALAIYDRGDCLSLAELQISGTELISLGVPPGPKIGRIKEALFDKVLSGALENQNKCLLKAAKTLIEEIKQAEQRS